MSEKVKFTMTATFREEMEINHGLNKPSSELHVSATDPRIMFYAKVIDGHEALNTVIAAVPMHMVLPATVTVELRSAVEKDARKALQSQMEKKYRKTLYDAIDFTQTEIKQGKLPTEKYFEAVTRHLYYSGWMDCQAELESESKSAEESKEEPLADL